MAANNWRCDDRRPHGEHPIARGPWGTLECAGRADTERVRASPSIEDYRRVAQETADAMAFACGWDGSAPSSLSCECRPSLRRRIGEPARCGQCGRPRLTELPDGTVVNGGRVLVAEELARRAQRSHERASQLVVHGIRQATPKYADAQFLLQAAQVELLGELVDRG